MVIKLYIDYASQPSRSVLSLCLIANIPHEVIETKIAYGENRSQSFKKINPMMKVPVIVDTDSGLILAQSHSILKYLAQKYNVSDPRKDIVKQAKINEFLDFHHLNTRKCFYLTFHIILAPILKVGDPTFNKEFTYKMIKSALRNFQSIYLKENKFLGGEHPCIADLIAFYDISMLEVLDFDYTNYPKIVKWLEEMRKIKEVQKADENFQKGKPQLIALRDQKPKL